MLGYDDPRSVTKHDYALARAMTIIDEERCPKCGIPAWWAFSTDNSIEFEIHERTCYSCAHKETHEADQAKNKIKPKAGTTTFVTAKSVFDDGELPTRRDFYEAMAKEK